MTVMKTGSDLEEQPDVALMKQKRLLSFLTSKKVPPIPSQEERKPFGEYHANPISKIMFWWVHPLLKVGYKRTITENDLFFLEEEQKVDFLYEKFKVHLNAGIEKSIQKFLTKKSMQEDETYDRETALKDYVMPAHVIPYALYKTLFTQYNVGIMYKIISDGANVCAPILQKKLIAFVEAKIFGYENYVGKGVGYVMGCCLLIFIGSVTINLAFYHLQVAGAKSRAILTRLLLDKSLSVAAEGNHLFPASKVQSMISTDLNRVDLAIGFFPFILTCFIPIAACIGLLIWNIGPSALVGIAIFIMIVFILGICMPRLMGLRKKASKFTDMRVDLMKELLKNYKMIKFYSWESSYSERIQKARYSEMDYLLTLQSLRNVLSSFAFAMPVLASMATFCTAFTISSGKNAADIFSSLSLFQTLAIQFMLVPMSLAMTSDLIVSMKKMGKYLTCDDIDPDQFLLEHFKDDQLALKIENADFEWDTFEETAEETNEKEEKNEKSHHGKKSNKDNVPSIEKDDGSFVADMSSIITEIDMKGKPLFSDDTPRTTPDSNGDVLEKTAFSGLHDINLEIKKGEFVVVTGSIGSGKSSLLGAMSGLMKRTNGKVSVDGDILLCGSPWVQNATLRDNITFGLPFDREKYEKVVGACSLNSDFAQFPGGDMTEVGERGITLSGGQKARINLARAVYADKDIILLDDVLSAVDAKVGKHIVEKCILGLLKDRTRIMATHQLSLIDSADKMIFLNGDGSIDIGTINELKSKNDKLLSLLQYQMDNTNADSNSSSSLNGENISMNLEKEEKEEKELLEQKLEIARTKTKIPTEPQENNLVDKDVVKIVGDEERAVNALKFSVYLNYCKLAFNKFPYVSPFAFIFFAVIETFCNYFANTWLSFWVEDKFSGRRTPFYMGLYIMFAFLYSFCMAFFFYLMCFYTNSAARLLNFRASQRILHVPMSFMDVSPIGRVLNRFTKDTDVLDNELIEQLRQLINPLCSVIGTIILCIIYIPWFAIAVPLIIVFYVVLANYYQASAREIKRLEAVKRSLVYSHFNEILSGKDTIKAYHIQEDVKLKLDKLIDSQNEAYYITLANQRWLGANLSVLAFCIVFIIAMLCVYSVFSIGAASTGLLLTYVMNLTGIMSLMMRALTQVENEFNSVERLNHYAFDLVQEKPYEIPENDPDDTWPQTGEITFTHVNMKYRPELPYVLHDLNIHINKGEKIGFCGRTGAGKSTFMTCLYRLTEFEGDIIIDDVDIKTLGLHKLRSKLTIIPQDPVLFIGTIRDNLDPFSEHSDDKLWDALCIAGLIKKENLPAVKVQKRDDEKLHKFHLNRVVEDDGSNFSIGERQLIALARALVRKTKILILDEATSSVDYETDSKIQRTIASEFDDCTILCIAHRLNTILNYDRIVVLDEGRVMEFDSPKNLFMNESGYFRGMCNQANITIDHF